MLEVESSFGREGQGHKGGFHVQRFAQEMEGDEVKELFIWTFPRATAGAGITPAYRLVSFVWCSFILNTFRWLYMCL